MLAVATVLCGPMTAWAEPDKPDWPVIPDNKGMDFFYGHWVGNHEQGGIYDFGPDGYRTSFHGDGPVFPYVVLLERPKYVLLLAYEKFDDGRDSVDFLYLRPEYTQGLDIVVGYCGSDQTQSMTIDDLKKDQTDLLAVWNSDTWCNPDLGMNGATPEYPWGNGWGSHFTYWRDNDRNNLPDWLDNVRSPRSHEGMPPE